MKFVGNSGAIQSEHIEKLTGERLNISYSHNHQISQRSIWHPQLRSTQIPAVARRRIHPREHILGQLSLLHHHLCPQFHLCHRPEILQLSSVSISILSFNLSSTPKTNSFLTSFCHPTMKHSLNCSEFS